MIRLLWLVLAVWILPAGCLLILYLCTFLSPRLRTWLLKHLIA
jgi:hypothetical protein